MPHASAGSWLPLSRYPSLDIASLDEAADIYSRMVAPVHLHGMPSKERFAWRVNHLVLGPLTLVANETRSSVWAECEGADDAYLLSVPLGADAAESSIGQVVTPLVRGRSGVIVRPRQRSKVVVHSGCRTLQVSVPQQAVLDAVTTLTGREPSDIQFAPRLALDVPEVASFMRLLGRVLKEADLESPDFTAPGAAERWAEALVFRLLLCQPHGQSALFAVRSPSVEPRYVRRAAEYFDAHVDRDVTMTELTRVTGVCARSLQNGFQKAHGCSPLTFARGRRLERARVLLLTHDGALTVSEVALSVGMAHLGRFSGYYRQHFGESPNATLARSHSVRVKVQ